MNTTQNTAIGAPAHFSEYVQVVWKYPLNLDRSSETVLEFARGSILRVDVQDGQVVAWVAVINQHTHLRRRIVIRGTGDPLPEDGRQLSYLNTFFCGSLVFHAFIGQA